MIKKNLDEKIKKVLNRNVEEIIERSSLEKKLKSKKVLRVKFGIDPTGPNLHLGSAIVLRKLKEFQNLGHQIILIFGDFTAQIGDPSDKLARRPVLSLKEIKKNLKNYKKQIGKILDLKKTKFYCNSKWLNKMTTKDLVKLARLLTVHQMITRRNFKKRFKEKKEIGLDEFLYPLFQGYDSVIVKADVEIGGSDQLFNLKVGRILQEHFGQKPQDILTTKMLLGLDGRKMSKTWGNIVNILDNPNDQFGKIMSMKDNLIIDYFKLATDLDVKEIKKMEEKLKKGKVNPRDLKEKLAYEIVKIYHGEKAAKKASKEFDMIFRKKELPSNIKIKYFKKKPINIMEFLVSLNLTSSKSEAKRLIKEGALNINNQKIIDWRKIILPQDGMVIRLGKRKFLKIKIKK